MTIRGRKFVGNVKENGNGVEQAQATSSAEAAEPQTSKVAPVEAEGKHHISPFWSSTGSDYGLIASTERTLTKVPESESRALSTERMFTSTSSFARTIWFPQRVDESGVSAKLEDGVLTVRVPKAEDKGSFKVNIE